MRCVITGVASGIGAALAREFSAWGYSIIGIDRDTLRGEALCRELAVAGFDVRFLAADLRDPDAPRNITEALAELGPTMVFIHCAGTSAVGRFGSIDAEAQREVLVVNVMAPLELTRALLARELVSAGGSFVFIASLSRFIGYPGAAAYAASKSGLASYARSLSVAVAPRGIHVLTVYPGPTRTPHARRFSPDNRREASRMPAERVARRVLRAVVARRRVLVPGLGNKVFAAFGFLCPRLADRVMAKLILEKLDGRPRRAWAPSR